MHTVPSLKVKAQQTHAEYIESSSDCLLNIDHSYSVHCEPAAETIQPERALFRSRFGPNYHPTFEVFLTELLNSVTLVVQDQDRTEVWRRKVYLTETLRNVPEAGRVPAEERLFNVRSQLIKKVNETVLKKLLDKLLENHVITNEEMESVRSQSRADKVRDVIDMVRKKGTKASSDLIAALCTEDPYLSRELKLM